jgi:hypothetical protein
MGKGRLGEKGRHSVMGRLRRKISGSHAVNENFGSVTSDLRCVLIVGVFDYFGYETRFIMGVSDFLLI